MTSPSHAGSDECTLGGGDGGGERDRGGHSEGDGQGGGGGSSERTLVTATMAMTALTTASTVETEAGTVLLGLRARATLPPRQAALSSTTVPTSR